MAEKTKKEENMNIKIGNLVTFKNGLYADEKDAFYRVMEINGDRVILEFVSNNTGQVFLEVRSTE